MDKAIGLITVLFILSMITEKITNFIRHYTPHLRDFWNPIVYFWHNAINKIGILRKVKFLHLRPYFKATDPKTFEKEQEFQIHFLSLLVGILCALFFNADIFILLKKSINEIEFFYNRKYFWDGENILWETVFGYLGTGLLLTFGSKFFHDLLDVLLFTKNKQREINAHGRLEAIAKAKDVIDAVSILELPLTSGDIAREAFKEKYSNLHGNVGSIATKNIVVNGASQYQLVVILVDNNTEGLPDKITINNEFDVKDSMEVPITYLLNAGIAMPNVALTPGLGIGNYYGNSIGTFGCILIDQDKIQYGLTCYHVLEEFHNPIRFNPIGILDLVSNKNKDKAIIGEIVYGKKDHIVDIALFRFRGITTGSSNMIADNGIVTRPASITKEDEISNEMVKKIGYSTQITEGYIANTNVETSIGYTSGRIILKGLFSITKDRDAPKRISEKGDSGALVINNKNEAIGIIVTSDAYFTYAIPMDSILDTIKTDFKPLFFDKTGAIL